MVAIFSVWNIYNMYCLLNFQYFGEGEGAFYATSFVYSVLFIFAGSSASPENVTSIPFNGTTSVYDTYGYFIHPHWKQFPPVPDEYHYMVGIYITFVGITGIIGNSIVIWIFST